MSKKQKIEVRKDMKKILGSLDTRWVKAASKELCQQLEGLMEQVLSTSDPQRSFRVLAWTRFFPGEVDLTSFISKHIGREQIFLPRSLPDGEMTFLQIGNNWLDDASPGVFGIPEPISESGTFYEPHDMGEDTIVIVPGLAFDTLGNRLGRGRGYYDRFLSQKGLRRATKIGVGWELQILKDVPHESHDILMDWVCHEKGILRTSTDYVEDDQL